MKRLTGAVIVAAVVVMAGRTAKAQTDLGASFYRTFTQSTTGNGTVQVPSDSYGAMIELRHISRPLLGYEISYGFNRANQSISPEAGQCGYFCSNPPYPITATASDIALNWIASARFGRLQPFALAGVGFFIFVPTSSQYDLNTIVRPSYSVGGGLDWDLAEHLGLRVQFRDNFYKAPDIAGIYQPTGVFTQSAEPSAGAYYRF